MRSRISAIVALPALLLLAGGCAVGTSGDGRDERRQDAPLPVITVSGSDQAGDQITVIHRYMEAIDDPDAVDARRAMRLTAPDSAARALLQHHLYRKQAAESMPTRLTPRPMSSNDTGGYQVCQRITSDSCHTYADFATIGGRLADLTVDGEQAADLVVVGGRGYAGGDHAQARVLSVLNGPGDRVEVAVEVKAGPEQVVTAPFLATYTDREGRVRDADLGAALGGGKLPPASTGVFVVAFTGVAPDGVLEVPVIGFDAIELGIGDGAKRIA